MRRTLSILAALLVATFASIDSAKAVTITSQSSSNPHPGVEIVEGRTEAPTTDFYAAFVSLCNDHVHVDASDYGGLRSAGSYASSEGAQLSVNGDFFTLSGTSHVYGDAVHDGTRWPSARTGRDSAYSSDWYYQKYGWIAFGDGWVEYSNTEWVKNNRGDLGADGGWKPGSVTKAIPDRTKALVSGFPQLVVSGQPIQCSSPTASSCFPDRSDMRDRHPRTAMGLTADQQTFILLVVDGRSTRSDGMYGTELADLIHQLGAHTAFNLDGGGSSQMWVDGRGTINRPSDGSPRGVLNHWGVFAGSGHGLGQLPGSCESYDIPVETSVRDASERNFYRQGESAENPDALPGDEFWVDIVVENDSPATLLNVQLGYLIEEPFLEAIDYVIYDDHPERDRESWEKNDANRDEFNEGPLGKTGAVNLVAFSPGESKRISIKLRAKRYSIGLHDAPDLRAWLWRADDTSGRPIYGPKESWSDDPGTDKLEGDGARNRSFRQFDVLSRNAWFFDDTDDPQNLEGWVAAGDEDYAEYRLDQETGELSLQVTGPDARVASPDWTSIDADRFDELVLQVRGGEGPHLSGVYWAGAGDEGSFSPDRVARFEVPTADENRLVIPLGEHPEWSGAIERLRIDPLEGSEPTAGAEPWYRIDYAYFQSSDDRTTTADERVDYVDDGRVTLERNRNGTTGGGSGTSTGGSTTGDAVRGPDGIGGGPDAASSGNANGTSSDQTSSSTCNTTDRPRPSSGLFALVLIALAGLFRRRRSAASSH